MFDLKGRTVLITGGTSGIGRATALAAASAGADVVITGRREREGEAVAEEIRKLGVKGLYLRADVASESDARRAVDAALNLTGRLDGAFNNAGYEGEVGRLTHEQTEENYRRVFDINVLGVLYGMKHQVPAMLKGGGGSIVNNASVAGSVGFGGMSVYAASKHAVIGLTRSAALDYATKGIRVNTVSPGAVRTEMFDRFTGSAGGAEFERQVIELHPVGRPGIPDEVAVAVLMLFSPASTFVTGIDLRVDGGLTAR